MTDTRDGLDRELSLLASRERREILDLFITTDAEVATVEELSRHLARVVPDGGEAKPPSTDAATVKLHHVHLPKLEQYDLLEYDSRSGTVRYHPDERMETIVEFLTDL